MTATIFLSLYGLFAVVATSNWWLMRRLKPRQGLVRGLVVLIPARNEAHNLRRLLPALDPSRAGVLLFDDESADGTGELATELGASVISPSEPLPTGWTGKNRACHELGLAALRDTDAEWLVFLDADVIPQDGFLPSLSEYLANLDSRVGVVSAFPKVLPGRGFEPMFLGWVGWILLSTNPFGLVSRTGKGHNRFTNGQFHAWRRSVYQELRPNETVRSAILEDVKMGRLCAQRGVRVEVINLSQVLHVRMYETWREAFDGMSKNSYEITGSTFGSIGLAVFLFTLGLGWLVCGPLMPWALGLFLWSGLMCALTASVVGFGLVLLPLSLVAGGITILRSAVWHRRGTVTWKGRTYPGA